MNFLYADDDSAGYNDEKVNEVIDSCTKFETKGEATATFYIRLVKMPDV